MIGVGGTGATGAALAAGSTGVVGAAGTPGWVGALAPLKPTTRPSICSGDVSSPMVETGIFVPSSESCPDGKVRLFAVRTPVIWVTDTPLAATLSGSSVMSRRCSRPPVTSARETPSIAAISGTISVRAISATASRPSSEVAPMDAMMTGEALMLSAEAFGVTESGSPAEAIPSSTAASASLTFVPYSNWAMTRAMELAEVDWIVCRRGTPETARSIGTATCSATSSEPAPG